MLRAQDGQDASKGIARMAETKVRRMTPDEFFAWQLKQDKL
jgi:hypothetical protein